MTKYINRHGVEEDFNGNKIYQAIVKAMKSGSGVYHQKIAKLIKEECEDKFLKKDKVTYKEIDKFVLKQLNEYGQNLTANAYERFKTLKQYQKTDDIIDKDIYGIVDGTNEAAINENSNKDAKLISTQRDLIAGIESRSYSERKIIPTYLLHAHNEGLIHIHDTDYMIHKGIFNCFSNDTVLVTDEGCKPFKDFYDGDAVKVKDKDGIWRDATIRKYGRQKLYIISMHSGRCRKEVKATLNHRWILSDGSVTTELKVGDKLYPLKNSTEYEPITKYEKRLFCLGFVIGDGRDMYNSGERDYGVSVRLCRSKNKYTNIFIDSGYDVAKLTKSNDNVAYNKKEIAKQTFLNSASWRMLNLKGKIALFNGYLAADSVNGINSVSTTDDRICRMIEEIAPIAGYFIASKTKRVRDTNYKQNAEIIDYRFIVEQKENTLWTIDAIEPYKAKSSNHNEMEAWCVEEPITHTFTLAGGIVTGNCMLINLKDMLDNGTVINGKMIETPKSFQTACTVATQISLQVANGQYGGQTFSVSHLAPYVRVSYNKYKKDITEQFNKLGIKYTEEQIDSIANKRTIDEIKSGVQTIQFQENTFSSTNGQTPFVSIFMYLNEDKEYIKETALIIEEMLKLRYQGMKNEYGVYVTPAFPKLLYVLDENNVPRDSEYRYLTDLAVKCAARRMNPDFISAKVMKEQFDGNVFPCMGCVDKDEVITYKILDTLHVESFERMWNFFDKEYGHKNQEADGCFYIDLKDVKIYDSTTHDFIQCKRIIKNKDKEDWVRVKMSNGRLLTCTSDHPLHIKDKGRVLVKDIQIGDIVDSTSEVYQGTKNDTSLDLAWLLGVMMCDANYTHPCFISSFALNSENDIIERYQNVLNNIGIETKVVERHRGKKGDYKDVSTVSMPESLPKRKEFRDYLVNCFGGVRKLDRKIPSFIFDSNEGIRKSFLGGVIDADGCIHSNERICHVEIDSTNKEMAIEEMLLANSLGYEAKIIENRYSSKDLSKIRYQVYFKAREDLLPYITCEKKRNNYIFHKDNDNNKYCKVSEITFLGKRNEYSYDVTTETDRFDVSGIASHNCRSFLSPWKDENGNYKFYGRFNRGVVTINLVDVALSSGGDEEKFWDILDERLELCKDALLLKDSLLRGASTKVSPIHWQNGAITRLSKDDTIDSLLDKGYSSISLGYIGIYEMTKYMTGESNTSDKGSHFADKVISYLEEKTIEWRKIKGLNGCSLYGTPSESLCYKFALKTQKRFGVIKDVTDKEWFTNSYHVNVMEEIDAFSKLKFESNFQKKSKGGAVSYIEVPNMDKNLEALSQIVDYMYETIQYAEINTRNGDSCGTCGFTGTMKCDENGEWYCPQCGERDHDKLTVVRRTCGYIGSTFWNKGKTQEINDRVLHI